MVCVVLFILYSELKVWLGDRVIDGSIWLSRGQMSRSQNHGIPDAPLCLESSKFYMQQPNWDKPYSFSTGERSLSYLYLFRLSWEYGHFELNEFHSKKLRNKCVWSQLWKGLWILSMDSISNMYSSLNRK